MSIPAKTPVNVHCLLAVLFLVYSSPIGIEKKGDWLIVVAVVVVVVVVVVVLVVFVVNID